MGANTSIIPKPQNISVFSGLKHVRKLYDYVDVYVNLTILKSSMPDTWIVRITDEWQVLYTQSEDLTLSYEMVSWKD